MSLRVVRSLAREAQVLLQRLTAGCHGSLLRQRPHERPSRTSGVEGVKASDLTSLTGKTTERCSVYK